MAFLFIMEKLVVIAIALEEDGNKRRRRRWSTHPLLETRKKEEEFQICKTLADCEDKFYDYFKMSRTSFNVLLEKIKPIIEKNNTNWKQSICTTEGTLGNMSEVDKYNFLSRLLHFEKLINNDINKPTRKRKIQIYNTCKYISYT